MNRLIFRISLGTLALALSAWQVWACAIANGPTPLLTAYLKSVSEKVNGVKSAVSGTSCGNAGAISDANRLIEVLDRIDAQNPVFPDIVSDFQYRIMLVVSWDARSPVMRMGQVIRNLEEQTILPAMKQLGSQCALDTSIDGGTPESVLTDLLVKNKSLESFFRQVALGDPTDPGNTGLPKDLLDEIAFNYSKDATISCKGDSGLANLMEKGAELMKWITDFSGKTAKMNDDWKIALDLFRGTATNYNDIQKKLLSEELSRQGMTKWAADSILTSLDCMQKKTEQWASPEDWGKARMECFGSLIVGGNAKVKEVFSLFGEPKTTDEYLKRRLDQSQSNVTASRDITSFYRTTREKLAWDNEERINEKMMTDLIEMHIKLRETSTLLEKRIPEMQTNCMKWQPDIVGGCKSK
jgi:hypothetical protein